MSSNRCLASIDDTHWCQKRLINGACSTHGPKGAVVGQPREKKIKGKGKRRRAASQDA